MGRQWWKMGRYRLFHKVKRSEIKPGDHIYTYRAAFTYSHHGIYVGGGKVVHFGPRKTPKSTSEPSDPYDSSCENSPDCGFRQPNSGVALTCLDCFLGTGSLYRFEYGVPPLVFLAHVRGGACTTAPSEPRKTVIHRAMYLLKNGFGDYHLFQNNCEDLAMYCKTGLLIMGKPGLGKSSQAGFFGGPFVALFSLYLMLMIPSPVWVAMVTAAGMYCVGRLAADIGARTDMVKVNVEDLAAIPANSGWRKSEEEVEWPRVMAVPDLNTMWAQFDGAFIHGSGSSLGPNNPTLHNCFDPTLHSSTFT